MNREIYKAQAQQAISPNFQVIAQLTMVNVTMPKNKEDFVEALVPLVRLDRQELRAMKMEELRAAWRSLKPAKRNKVLPSQWRKMNRLELQVTYQDYVVPFYSPQDDGRWLDWPRDMLIVELKQYEAEALMMQDEEPVPLAPTCERCGLVMLEKTNRMDGSKFYGCLRFPLCRQTLPLTVAKQPAAVMQKAQKEKELRQFQEFKAKKTMMEAAQGMKTTMMDGGEDMGGNVVKRAFRPGGRATASSQGSWTVVEEKNDKVKVEISKEDLEMLRQAKAEKTKSQASNGQ